MFRCPRSPVFPDHERICLVVNDLPSAESKGAVPVRRGPPSECARAHLAPDKGYNTHSTLLCGSCAALGFGGGRGGAGGARGLGGLRWRGHASAGGLWCVVVALVWWLYWQASAICGSVVCPIQGRGVRGACAGCGPCRGVHVVMGARCCAPQWAWRGAAGGHTGRRQLS